MTSSAVATVQPRRFQSFNEMTSFIWSIADLLRGDYKQSDYGKVALPFTVLRRLDCVLDATRQQVLARHESLQGSPVKNRDPILNRITGVPFHNISQLTFDRLKDDPGHVAANVTSYIRGFSDNAREIFIERFKFPEHMQKLDEANLLYQVVCRFAEVDLHPEAVSNHVMGSIFEELIRRFSEQSNETAGEHFTPREVIRLMVNLLFMEDHDVLTRPGIVKTLYDPACGTGGMLSVAEESLREEKAFQSLASSKKRGQAGEMEAELGRRLQSQLLAMLQTLDTTRVWTSRDAFQTALHAAARQSGLKLPAPVQKAILSALSERDEEAEVCTDSQGNPESDSDLRDYENVPLKEAIDSYFEREMRPHVPDAWRDEDKTRIGYEIPFTRHFYEYKPLRPLDEIEAEIRGLEAEIQGMLGEVLG